MKVTSQSVTQSHVLYTHDVTTDNTTSDLYKTNIRREQNNQNKQSIPYIKIPVISLKNNSRWPISEFVIRAVGAILNFTPECPKQQNKRNGMEHRFILFRKNDNLQGFCLVSSSVPIKLLKPTGQQYAYALQSLYFVILFCGGHL
jgi:hypothetical protein